MVLLVSVLALSLAAGAPRSQNMLPEQPYLIANALPGHESRKDTLAARGYEWFEVYSQPIRSRYSQVYWKTQDPVPLPAEIQRRFNGSVMAVVGFEVDVVRRDNATGDESSVPCYESYNHHYTAMIRGRGVKLDDTTGLYPSHGATGDQITFTAEDGYVAALDARGDPVPGVQSFNEHNGNEARQSYHGLPLGVIQPILSPLEFIMAPMQINTRNPDGGGRGGPLPSTSRAPPNASYSGILECPCTSRTVKVVDGHQLIRQGACSSPVRNASECFAAAAEIGMAPVASTRAVQNKSLPDGCFAQRVTGGYEIVYNSAGAGAGCPGAKSPAADGVAGSAAGIVNVSVSISGDAMDAGSVATITVSSADSKAWFGVGFGAQRMADAPWALIFEGDGTISERKLADHAMGQQLSASIKVVSNTVDPTGSRTVVVTRPAAGRTADYYTFDASQATLPYIAAVGSTPKLSAHKANAAGALQMLSLGVSACVCRGGKGGSINGVPYKPACYDYPKSDLLRQHNPTCDVSTYVGGLACCRGDVFLLDADQEIPEYVDEVFYKWRFYYSDFKPEEQASSVHLEWQLGHIEYDVTQSPPGTPAQEAVHTLKSDFTGRDFLELAGGEGCNPVTQPYCVDFEKFEQRGLSLVMAGGHCHAPACLSLELFNGDTGELICRIEPVHGQADTSKDEDGYLWLPPCQWGTEAEGLAPPPEIRIDSNFTSIKRANSTYYHYGVMAIWQMRAVYM